MLRLSLLALCLIGCAPDPDYSATHFACDATHGCPDGQTCSHGMCGGGGSAVVGVECDGALCTPAQDCCVDSGGPTQCVPSGTCAGIAAACDGIEDCSGSPCCDGGDGRIACHATCAQPVCLDDSDCVNAGQGVCCFGLTDAPWGACALACP